MNTNSRSPKYNAVCDHRDIFRVVASSMRDIAICICQDDFIRYASLGMEKLTGYPAQEIMGMNLWEMVHPDFRELAKARGHSCQRGKLLSSKHEFIMVDKDGDEHWVDFSGGYIDYGKQPAAVFVLSEITEHKEALQALQASEEKYRNLVEQASDGIVILQDGLIKYANRHAAETFGYWLDEFIGLPFSAVGDPDITTKMVDSYQRRIAGEYVPQIFEAVGKHKNGHPVFMEYNVVLTIYQEKAATLIQIRDISDRRKADQELYESQEKFRILAETAAAAIFIYKKDRFYYVNPTMERLTGYSNHELQGMKFFDLVHTGFKDYIKACNDILRSGEPVSGYEFIIIDKNGQEHWVDYHAGIIEYEGGPAVIGTAYDITELKKAAEALREGENRYRLLVETLQGGIWVIDKDAKTTYVNPCMAEMLGYTVDEMIGKDLYSFMDDIGVEVCKRNMERREQGVKALHDFEFLRKDGRRLYANFETSQITNEQGNHIGTIAGVMDITARRRTEEIIIKMAYHDALTGLPNRMLFKDRLTMAMSYATRNKKEVAVMMLDLDKFKEVNDTLGHSMGDLLLKSVSERLLQLLRMNDTVARIGGDEFMIVLPEISSSQDAGIIAQKMIHSFETPFMFDDHELRITTSIGIALYPADGKDVETLIKHADMAMYSAKAMGRNAYRYYGDHGNQS
jgi:diguanylate cyclase (GGDEF)-like protein/PAS domain S-box-containing protein